MHYMSFDLKKIFIVLIAVTTLSFGVWGTFSYKNHHFGDVNLPYALKNSITKHGLYLVYLARSGGQNLMAGAFSSFQSEATYDSKQARAIPVLVYHNVDDRGGYSIAPDQFLDQMETLHEAGWQTITLADFASFVKGEKDLPERSFLLTFDDGAKNSYYPVDPILKVLGYNAVSFILPKYSTDGGTHYYLSEGEIKTMLESGRWEIGSHGQDSHEFGAINADGDLGAKLANYLWLANENRLETDTEYQTRIRNDLTTSKQNLEETFGLPIYAFAFPFGEFGQLRRDFTEAVSNDIEEIARSVYSLAFYQTWEGEGYSFNYKAQGDSLAFMVKRYEPKPDTTGQALLQKLEAGLPKELPLTDGFDTDIGWFSSWGEVVLRDSALVFQANSDETGAAAVLDGARDWEDYHQHLTLTSESGSGFVVFARFQDNANFAGCNFGNGFLHTEETIDGIRRVIRGVRDSSIAIPTNREFTVEVTVEGRTLRCTLDNGISVETTFLDESLSHGGTGIKVWNANSGVANLRVESIEVTPVTNEQPDK